MRLRCKLSRHDWTPGAAGTIAGADMYPPGSGAVLPSWCDIALRVEHCPHCEAVRAVASWQLDGRDHKALVSVAWALWQLMMERKK